MTSRKASLGAESPATTSVVPPPSSRPAAEPPEKRHRLSVLGLPWLLIGSLLLLSIFLVPARNAALRGDDEWTFELRGQLALSHRTLLSQIGSDISVAFQHFRPQILGKVFSDPALYYFQGHPSLYRLYLVALTVVCGGLLWALVRGLGGPPVLAALAVILFAGAVQFREYHDPLLGYYGATQFALAFVLGSLLALLKSLKEGGRRWAVLAVLLFACGCGMQEYVYPLAIVHLCVAFTHRRGWGAVRAALPVMVIGLALMAGGYLGRNGLASSPDAVPSGYGTSLNVHRVLASYLTQLVPPLPASNRLFSSGPIAYFYVLGSSPTAPEILAGAWRGAVVFGAVLAFVFWLVRMDGISRLSSSGISRRLVAVGLPFWLTPPILLSVSQKYQQELTFGKGYVDVLLQVVGFALVASAVLLVLIRIAERRGRAAVLVTALAAAVLLGLGAGVDGFNNLRIVAREQPTRQTRDLLETAAANGVFNRVPQRSTLLLSAHDTYWPTGSWAFGGSTGEDVLYADSGRNFDVRFAADQIPLNCGSSATFPPPSCASPERLAAWVRVRARYGGGVVTVSRLTEPRAATIRTERTTDILVYIAQSGHTPPQPPLLTGTLPSGRRWLSAGLQWRTLRADSDWAIYTARIAPRAAPVAYSINYPLSPVDFLVPAVPDREARLFHTKQLLP